jgi:hypothetical protein
MPSKNICAQNVLLQINDNYHYPAKQTEHITFLAIYHATNAVTWALLFQISKSATPEIPQAMTLASILPNC